MERFVVYYFQLSGVPGKEELPLVWGEMHKAYERLQERFYKAEETEHTYLTYDESFEKWMDGAEGEEWWRSRWGQPLYHDFATPDNLQWIIQRILNTMIPAKAYVLGSGVGIRQWLPYVADRVHSIEFYLEFVTKGVQQLQEMLLEEYGMLTEVHLTESKGFSKPALKSEEPVLVVDFAGMVPISVLGLKKGSIWVDMDAVESKRHTIEDRPCGLQYYSLKTIWRREMIQTLDIIGNIAYNTDVKIGRF